MMCWILLSKIMDGWKSFISLKHETSFKLSFCNVSSRGVQSFLDLSCPLIVIGELSLIADQDLKSSDSSESSEK